MDGAELIPPSAKIESRNMRFGKSDSIVVRDAKPFVPHIKTPCPALWIT